MDEQGKSRQVFGTADDRASPASEQYEYCPSCGHRLTFTLRRVDGKQRGVCSACGWVRFKNPLPAVVVLVQDQGRLLVGRRADGSCSAGRWCLPGGFIEFDEDFLSAAVREVREETGLTITIESIVNVVSNFLSPDLHSLVVVLLASATGGKPNPGDDLMELRWIPQDGLIPDLAFEADRYIVEAWSREGLHKLPVGQSQTRRERRPGE